MKRRLQVGVIGSGNEDGSLNKQAERVGELIAGKGFILVNGGLGGVMAASARGATKAGGTVVGLIPGSERKAANAFTLIIIPTGMGEMRNALIIRASDGIIAVGGGFGTLSELGLALKAGKPVVAIDSWNVTENIIKAKDADEAMRLLLKSLKIND